MLKREEFSTPPRLERRPFARVRRHAIRTALYAHYWITEWSLQTAI